MRRSSVDFCKVVRKNWSLAPQTGWQNFNTFAFGEPYSLPHSDHTNFVIWVRLRWTNVGSVPGSQTRHEFRYMNMCVVILRWGDHRLTSVKLFERTGRLHHKRVDRTSIRSPLVNHTLCLTVTIRISLYEFACGEPTLVAFLARRHDTNFVTWTCVSWY